MSRLKLGVIADDFTGATDIASFMVNAGWRVVQQIGVPDPDLVAPDVDAIVIALKSRSCPVDTAISETLASARWLKSQGAAQLFFKYCSTFDSTAVGNIGPVADALLQAFNIQKTIFCPALSAYGRTVVHGHLFVNGQLLNESGMQNHPVNPMMDANLCRVLAAQSSHKVGLIDYACVDAGAAAMGHSMAAQLSKGTQFFIVDTLNDSQLQTIAEAVRAFELVTGGSGLGGALAALDVAGQARTRVSLRPINNKTVILSGSCSVMTNQQVAYYCESGAPHQAIDVTLALKNTEYANDLTKWVLAQYQQNTTQAPLLYATQSPENLRQIQAEFGAEVASLAVERLFSQIAQNLAREGICNFIVAGGETSGAITQALQIKEFEIGDTVAPGVPWVKAVATNTFLCLKSGNFGDVTFFQKAQD